ncbi:cupredoxin domain-containing protein [Arthrobacter sp. H5]|uniref:cupredoxin domain-containing protein n=1 Tax=Arthrobacter sp. H5 TaxID=1267973 RepID=UPI0004B02FDF|nr:cupredoxin domain-containing protein [Arthrobacter sp. H5]
MKVRNGISALLLAGLLTGTAACGSETGPSGSEVITAPSEAAAPESAAATTGAPGGSASGSASAEAAPAEEAMITIKDFEYEMPETIAPGTMVTVVNEDEAPHTVTAKDDGGFDVDVPAGETVTFTAPEEAGDYAIICTYHPQMSGTLVIG